jgi:predicted transport protein
VAYPFLLELYADYATGILAKDEFVTAVRLVEAYVFRRAVSAIPTNSLNKTFATLGRALKKDRYLESMQAHLLLLPSYRRFPADEEFKQDLATRDLYNFRSRSYWLRRLENYGRKERVPVDEYTIEHIMPQNENLSAEWREALGPDWERVHQTLLHTLGNLTLTGYNSEYSDRPFAEKRDMSGGFRDSPLKVNEGLAALDTWDEATINARAAMLGAQAAQVWTAPKLASDVLGVYRPANAAAAQYTILDHANLAIGTPMRPVFEAFGKQVRELDPVVSEEFRKLYVAYKAETNFVDVIPQQKRLLLSLNIDPHELHDPREIGRDVTNLGRWGQWQCGSTARIARRAVLRDGPSQAGLREPDGRRRVSHLVRG